MESVKTLYGKAFWYLFGGITMFFNFVLLPLAWAYLGFNFQISAVVSGCFTLIFAPLVVWRLIERLATDDAGYYYVWGLKTLASVGKQVMLQGNPVGWLGLGLAWCGRWILKCLSFICLIIAVLIP